MRQCILLILVMSGMGLGYGQGMSDAELVKHLRQVYDGWRGSMVNRNAGAWKRFTSETRQVKVRNRIWSEKRSFPATVFEAPGSPPDVGSLKPMRVRVMGSTAKATYFGKVDFGVGGTPTDNLFVISYVREATGWKYHEGEFVKLDVIPEVRKQLGEGNLSFLDGPDFHPTGVLEAAPMALLGPVKYIAKVYVFCPGREVQLMVNGMSRHLFQNTRQSEVVIGGARDGLNEMQFQIKEIEGGDPKAPVSLRIYLMSEVEGTMPIKAAEYQVEDGSKPKASGTVNFTVTPEMGRILLGR